MALPQHELVKQAQNLRENEALGQILDLITDRHTRRWQDSSPEDQAAREIAFQMVKAIQELRTEINAVAMTDAIVQYNRRLRGKTV